MGRFEVDTSPLDEADVIVFRRYYNTWTRCANDGCEWVGSDNPIDRIVHVNTTGHLVHMRDEITRLAWKWLRDRDDKALIYETDDNHFTIKPWNGYYTDVLHEQPLISEMARRADLLTASTPRLASFYARFNPNVRVIRNALDPSLYVPGPIDAEPWYPTKRSPEGKVRVLYYGSDARMRDYLGQVDDRGRQQGGGAYFAMTRMPHLWRTFIGWNGNEWVIPYFDELVPYVSGFEDFGRAMANARPDIGIAPLVGDDFDACKSELHWLEYAAVGAATVAQRMMGESPYSVIRDGVDGLLAKGKAEWEAAVGRLAREPNLRADIAAAARERLEREYDYRVRAPEWIDAFREALDNRGRGLTRLAA